MKIAAAVIAGALAASAGAQVREGAAIAPQAEVMRKAWAASPTKPVQITVPLFGRIIAFDLLRDFVPAYEAKNASNYIMEFLPDGQNFQNWTRMVTVTGARGNGGTTIGHLDLAAGIFGGSQGCESGPFYIPMGERTIAPSVTEVTISRGCARVASDAYPGANGAGEQSLILHYRDGENTYSLQYAERGPFRNGAPPFTSAAVRGQLAKFGTVRLCALDATDAACKTVVGIERMRASGK